MTDAPKDRPVSHREMALFLHGEIPDGTPPGKAAQIILKHFDMRLSPDCRALVHEIGRWPR